MKVFSVISKSTKVHKKLYDNFKNVHLKNNFNNLFFEYYGRHTKKYIF